MHALQLSWDPASLVQYFHSDGVIDKLILLPELETPILSCKCIFLKFAVLKFLFFLENPRFSSVMTARRHITADYCRQRFFCLFLQLLRRMSGSSYLDEMIPFKNITSQIHGQAQCHWTWQSVTWQTNMCLPRERLVQRIIQYHIT